MNGGAGVWGRVSPSPVGVGSGAPEKIFDFDLRNVKILEVKNIHVHCASDVCISLFQDFQQFHSFHFQRRIENYGPGGWGPECLGRGLCTVQPAQTIAIRHSSCQPKQQSTSSVKTHLKSYLFKVAKL